ncbi:putative glyoxalase/bleomycin resistance protein/dioxygenase [Mycobacterium xenopi 3993]|nr:putative glyoxalase/bleomycin resistance protein/dioxygenase [Mycobacterium xenopi 3993]
MYRSHLLVRDRFSTSCLAHPGKRSTTANIAASRPEPCRRADSGRRADTVYYMRRVDYVIQYVESLNRSVTFYRDVIGLTVRIEGTATSSSRWKTPSSRCSNDLSCRSSSVATAAIRRAARSPLWWKTSTPKQSG